MKKVLVVNVTSSALVSEVAKGNYSSEFELTELNRHLSEGWSILKYDIVPNQTGNTFSIIYQLISN
jgi:hypothetical protein